MTPRTKCKSQDRENAFLPTFLPPGCSVFSFKGKDHARFNDREVVIAIQVKDSIGFWLTNSVKLTM